MPGSLIARGSIPPSRGWMVNSATRCGRRSPASTTWLIRGSNLNIVSTRDGKDLLAVRRYDQFLLAARDVDVAVGIDGPDVAGVQPAVAQQLRPSLRGPCNIRAKEWGCGSAIRLRRRPGIRRRAALCRCCRARRVERIKRRDAAFGQPVAFDQRHADRFVKFREIRAQRSGAGGRDHAGGRRTGREFC